MAIVEAPSLPPLPAPVRDAVLGILGPGGTLAPQANPGLVFERYPRCWQPRTGHWDLDESRKTFLRRFVEGYERLRSRYQPALTARLQSLDRTFGDGREYQARWRFVTGVGSEHPLENGFTFHRLLGVPFFSGSTVKGLARAAARLSGVDKDDELRLFGSEAPRDSDERLATKSGGVVFLDALPVTWPELGVDLINNHRPTWTALLNAGGTDLGPAERASAAGLEDPVPVVFLAVEPGVKLRFWIKARPGSGLAQGDLDRVWECLELGLRYLGIGAKTAVGYGRFAAGDLTPDPARSPVPGARPKLEKGDRVKFELTRQSKKGKWQGRLADEPDSFGTLLGDPPADAAVGMTYEVIVAVGVDLQNLNLRWP
jgi:CRISPR-associated protein Cmr6